jgi:hypothetical protein
VSPLQVFNLLGRPLVPGSIAVDLSELSRVVVDLTASLAALIVGHGANKQLPVHS